MKKIFALMLILSAAFPRGWASEVLEESTTRVVVREHPRTGRPYVSIVPDASARDPFEAQRKKMKRPDYRMLDPKIKSGAIPYEGPVSDRKKVYLLAGTLAATGAVAGTAVILAAPAATRAAAAGGAGAYGAAGVGVLGGTVSAATLKMRPDPKHDKLTSTSTSTLQKISASEAVSQEEKKNS